MKKGDVIRQKCVNTTFYLTGILAHKVNNIGFKIETGQKYNISKPGACYCVFFAFHLHNSRSIPSLDVFRTLHSSFFLPGK